MLPNAANRVLVCGLDAPAVGAALAARDFSDIQVLIAEGQDAIGPGVLSGADVMVWGVQGSPSAAGLELGTFSRYPCPVVVTTSEASEEAALALVRAGATEVVVRPPDGDVSDALVSAVRRARARFAVGVGRGEGRSPTLPSHGLLTGALEGADLLVLVTDVEGVIEYVNPYWCAQTGYGRADAIGQTPRILESGKMAAQDYDVLWKRITSGRVWHGHLVNRRADGSEYVEQMVIAPLVREGRIEHYLHVGLDATASVGVSDTAARVKRLETLGCVVGGMAHEFNNIFGVILANAELISGDGGEAGFARAMARSVEDIRGAVDKGQTLVRRLLMYTGRWRIRPKLVDLAEELTQLSEELAASLPSSHGLDVHTEALPGPSAWIDREALAEVLGQLVMNAREAMPEGGRIGLHLDTRVLDGAFSATHPWATVGTFACVSVRDHGAGMDEATRAGLFDLPSGDKMSGGLSGLGLAMTYHFMKQHGGFVVVESALGQGTTVDLLFPAANVHVAHVDKPLDERGEPPSERARTVLLAEDDERLRRAARRILESAGFEVMEAEDGRRALDILRSAAARIDLVLSDLMMPDIGGAELYRLVQGLDAPPRFLFTTGHADVTTSGNTLLPAGVPYVLKPWSRQQLLAAIEDVLAK